MCYRHRVLRWRCECCRLWPLVMLPSRMLAYMVMGLKRKRDSRARVVVREMVVHRGMSHWVME